jgi:hypothetical protein
MMNPRTALAVQVALILVGLAALAFLLVEPHLEGRNAHATWVEIYFHDPFLGYVYVGAWPFFLALYRALGLFGGVRKTGAFSPASLAALHTIRRCALAIAGLVAGAVVFILVAGDKDDRPAGFFLCLLVALGAGLMAVAAGWLARKVRAVLASG